MRHSPRRTFWFSIWILSCFVSSSAFGAEIANGNGGFEMNGFSESPGLPDLDASSSPGSIDSWAYSRPVSPLAALARNGPNYATREGSYMLGLGTVPDDIPGYVFSATADAAITGLTIGEDYVVSFWFAPGYVVVDPPGDLIFGSGTDATEATDLVVLVTTLNAEVANLFYSAIPSVKTTPTPATSDWQMGSLSFAAPATELNLSFAALPTTDDTADSLKGFYFVDDVTIAVPEPSSTPSEIVAGLCVAVVVLHRRRKPDFGECQSKGQRRSTPSVSC